MRIGLYLLLGNPPAYAVCGNQVLAVFRIVKIVLHKMDQYLSALRKACKNKGSSLIYVLDIILKRSRNISVCHVKIGLHFSLGLVSVVDHKGHLSVIRRIYRSRFIIDAALHIDSSNEILLNLFVGHRHIGVSVLCHINGGSHEEHVNVLSLSLGKVCPILLERIIYIVSILLALSALGIVFLLGRRFRAFLCDRLLALLLGFCFRLGVILGFILN